MQNLLYKLPIAYSAVILQREFSFSVLLRVSASFARHCWHCRALTTTGSLGAASHPAAAAPCSRAVSHHSSFLFHPTAPVGSGLVTQAPLLRRAWLLASTRLCPGQQMAHNVANSPAVCIQVTALFCVCLISSLCARHFLSRFQGTMPSTSAL